MDLNYLLSRHLVSLMRATSALSVEARHAHRAFAKHYAERIREFHAASGAGVVKSAAVLQIDA